MKPSSDLYLLIHSLSANEKGYFKKYCQRNGSTAGKKYLLLFDALASQKDYNEDKLRKKLSDTALLKNLPSEKNYLYHLILESLLAGKTTDDPLYECELLVAKARWLSGRSFFEQASRFAEKARQKARQNEYYVLSLDVLDIELLLWQYLPGDVRRNFEDIIEERRIVRQEMTLTDELRLLDMEVIRLFQEIGIGRSENQLEKYRTIFSKAQHLYNTNPELPVRAQTYYYNIGVFYNNVIGSAEASLNDLRSMVTLMENHPAIRKERLSFYISSLNNIILLLLHMGKYEEAEQRIDQLVSIGTETPNQENTLFITRYNTRFELYTLKSDWKNLLKLSQDLKEEIKHYEKRLDNRYTGHIRFAAFRSCFYTGNFREAQQWINQLVQKSEGEPFKSELVSVARIAEIVLHETLGNYDLADNLLLSAKRFFNKNNALYPFEKVMFDFFTKRFQHPEDDSLFDKLNEQLETVSKDILQHRVLNYFNFPDWARARKKGILIKDLN